jgi:hypothetical protein
LANYTSFAGGYVNNPDATANCDFCIVRDTNTLLAGFGLSYDLRWRNFGIMWAFIAFNVAGAVFLYWLARVPKKPKEQEEPLAVDSGEKENPDRGTLAGVGSTEKRVSAQTAPTVSGDKDGEMIGGQHEIRVEPSQDTMVASEGASHEK